MERDVVSFIPSTATFTISTHTLTWSVTILSVTALKRFQHFNSHAHVERDMFDQTGCAGIAISTHTLTWSVTTDVWITHTWVCISTHTLTWSVTK